MSVLSGLELFRRIVFKLIIRSSLSAMPLLIVIALCTLMMGWPGKAPQSSQTAANSGLAAQAALIPTASIQRADARPMHSALADASAEAAFERLHITHANIHVPR